MSKCEPSTNVTKLCNPCCNCVKKLEDMVIDLHRKENFNQYVINYMTAELCLCLNMLKKVQTAIEKAIHEQEEMSEILCSCLERGVYLTYNDGKMYYPGVHRFAEWKAENCKQYTSSPPLYHYSNDYLMLFKNT